MTTKNPPKLDVSFAPILQELGIKETKAIEISNLLKTIDEKSKEWETLANIKVEGPEDAANIKLSGKNRLKIKNERLEIEKFIKSKRDGVKEEIEEYLTEDKAYLKIFQFYEKKAKENEEILKEAEETWIRFEKNRLDTLKRERQEKLSEVCEQYAILPVETMSEEDFNTMYETYRLAKLKREEEDAARLKAEEDARVEAERLELELQGKREVFSSRRSEMAPYFHLEYEGKGTITIDTSEEDYGVILTNAKAALKLKQEEDEKLRVAEQKRLEVERRNKSITDRLFSLGLQFNGTSYVFGAVSVNADDVLKLDDVTLEKYVSNLTAKISAERIAMQKAKEEEATKRDEEIKKQLAEMKAKVVEAPVVKADNSKTPKIIISEFIDTFTHGSLDASVLSNSAIKEAQAEILKRFEGFKKWGKNLIP